jgi:hypothetical protein
MALAVQVAELRKLRKLQGVSPLAIMEKIQTSGLHQVTMMTGDRNIQTPPEFASQY